MRIIEASEGKTFRRISDGRMYGRIISLGKTYSIDGVELDEPKWEYAEDFEEVDIPIEEELDDLRPLND